MATTARIIRFTHMSRILVIFIVFVTSSVSFSQDCDTCEIFVPNAITPDCDQYGCEFLKITSNCAIYEFELKIFNRWGALVFESLNQKKEFDSSSQKDGTYLWTLSGAFCDNQKFELNGYLNVIR